MLTLTHPAAPSRHSTNNWFSSVMGVGLVGSKYAKGYTGYQALVQLYVLSAGALPASSRVG